MKAGDVKRWPGWVLLAAVVVGTLLVGATRDSGPRTDEERADAIAQRLACPECRGESVSESQSPAANNIRIQIRKLIQDGLYSDDDIIGYIEQQFGADVLLVPRATGVDSLVWIVPVVAGCCAVAGLAVAFRRWRTATDTVPTDDDRELVAAARREQE